MTKSKPVARSGPKRRCAVKQELIATLGDRLHREFPATRFNFTQPIIDSVTEDTNGTAATLAVRFLAPTGRSCADWP